MATSQISSRYAQSHLAHHRAKAVLPGGVNSPVRAFKAVGREPITVVRGKGATVTDLDGNSYIDYVLSYGPLILGHAPEAVTAALQQASAGGTSFGMPTEAETILAEMVIQAVPSMQVVRFVNSGTEATMSAIRLARGATNRPMIVKCTGCYHGHSDGLLVQAGSGALTLGVPSSPGVPAQITANTLLAPYNNLDAMRRMFAQHGRQIAGIIIEPIAGNVGTIPPSDGYLQGLRDLCDEHRAILIFDEVMTGFRVAYGGAQALYNVRPDLTCLGKVIGGGLPCAAYGGREDLMRQMAPDGPIYQAGTLSGNPLAMAAGIAMLQVLRDGKAYAFLEERSRQLAEGIEGAARAAGVAVRCARVGSMLTPFFTGPGMGKIENSEIACQCDTQAFATFFGAMLDRGVVLPPSQFETWFLSIAHDAKVIDETIAAAADSLRVVAESK